jgi:hypothetical protein
MAGHEALFQAFQVCSTIVDLFIQNIERLEKLFGIVDLQKLCFKYIDTFS